MTVSIPLVVILALLVGVAWRFRALGLWQAVNGQVRVAAGGRIKVSILVKLTIS
ncbi:hypothetical protein [Acrocarpospora catenulata]|uniref:hypothetical protein n=1 Tax=Acrocarpospora catenulata TaxID=2836182 RepID=UPI001BDAB3D3|nr:hypothetical protein [Acrocarpospora catenulata]